MAGDTPITIVGNLTADPELRFTQGGDAVANFTVASTPRTFDKQTSEWRDADTLFMRCSIWREAAENVAESLTKGARVLVTGRLVQRSWETPEGEKRTSVEMQAEEVGPSLRWATAQVTRAGNNQGGGQQQNRQQRPAQQTQPPQQRQQLARDPQPQQQAWNPTPGAYDEPPF